MNSPKIKMLRMILGDEKIINPEITLYYRYKGKIMPFLKPGIRKKKVKVDYVSKAEDSIKFKAKGWKIYFKAEVIKAKMVFPFTTIQKPLVLNCIRGDTVYFTYTMKVGMDG